jgi:hypothetical protein
LSRSAVKRACLPCAFSPGVFRGSELDDFVMTHMKALAVDRFEPAVADLIFQQPVR